MGKINKMEPIRPGEPVHALHESDDAEGYFTYTQGVVKETHISATKVRYTITDAEGDFTTDENLVSRQYDDLIKRLTDIWLQE
jgi:hypothetical protein